MFQALPTWMPSDALFLGLVGLLVSLVAMNRGRWWAIEAMDTDEPLVVGIGIMVAAMNEQMAALVGGGGSELWLGAGIVIALSGVVLWARKE